jgi:hypothetical protein
MWSLLLPCRILMNIKCISIYNMGYRIILIILLFTGIFGCGKRLSSDIPPDKFAAIYIDLKLSKASVPNADSLMKTSDKEILNRILKKHNVTPEQIRMTVDIYNKDVSKWKEFYENVSKRLVELKKDRSEKEKINPPPSSK